MDHETLEHEAERLLRLAGLAEQFNDEQIENDARSAAERIAEGRFYVACVGQFKRGKSTLLNALIGKPILPGGIVPVTAVPTILRFGEHDGARLRLQRGDWVEIAVDEIEQYVSEEKNPQNRKGVVGLEIFVPSPLLCKGMCFVDTPGSGSVFESNTAATHAFLPHIDAAIAVIGADPPIAGDELELVETVSKQVQDILFVLNKADRVSEEERAAAVSFARQVLENRLQRPIPFIFEISALAQIQSNGSRRDWAQFVDCRERLVERCGQQLVREASSRSLHRLAGQLFVVIREERDALTRPFEESEKRIGEMRETVAQAVQALNDLGSLFSGEQRRLTKTFGDRRSAFLNATRATVHNELDAALKSLPRSGGPHYRRSAMQAAQNAVRHRVMPWLEGEKKNPQQAYGSIAKRFTGLANEFLLKVRSFGKTDVTYLPKELSAEEDFRTGSEFQFYDFVHIAIPASPLRYMADVLLGLIRAHSAIDAAAHEFLDRLLETNSERVRNDLENRVVESHRQLEAEIRSMLRGLSAVPERALSHARSAHAAGAEAVGTSLKRLADAESELALLAGAQFSDH
jgi:hypothetical protein